MLMCYVLYGSVYDTVFAIHFAFMRKYVFGYLSREMLNVRSLVRSLARIHTVDFMIWQTLRLRSFMYFMEKMRFYTSTNRFGI